QPTYVTPDPSCPPGVSTLSLHDALPILILLAVTVGVTIAAGNPAAKDVGAVRRGEVGAAQHSWIVAEPPDRMRRIAVHSTREAEARVESRGDVARRHVDHTAECRRAIQR